MTARNFFAFALVIFTLGLAGCGGSGGDDPGEDFVGGSGGSGGTGGTGGTAGTGGTGGTTTTLRMGFLNPPNPFANGQIGIGQSPLSAGGSSSLTVSIVDQNTTLFTQPVDVTFSSPCIGNNLARVEPVTPGNTFNTTTGTINVTYVDIGCGASPGGTNDLITATASANGQNLSATGSILVQPSTIGSLQFVSANPTIIGLRGGGSGLPEQSTVIFRLLTSTGGAAPNRQVNFSLNNTAGGIEFGGGGTAASGTTDSNGNVQVVVRSGTVLTAVRVTATFNDPGPPAVSLSSQSSNLTISTGFPDQNSFDLVAESLNVRGFNFSGTIVPVTIRTSDRNNNPVPDGTAIAFTTEGGDIVSTCFTAAGVCSVNWESQNPRPQNRCDTDIFVDTAIDCEDDFESSFISPNGALRGGRSTILATAEGEESFTDLNGNGRFDDGDTFDDLDEAFQDRDENGLRDPALEPFVDYVHPNFSTGNFDVGDGFYNGQLCSHSTLCPAGTPTTFTVREELVIIMSGDTPAIRGGFGNISNFDDTTIADGDFDEAVEFCGPNDFVQFAVVVRDGRFQPMPVGTSVSISTSLGSVQGTSSFDFLNTIDDTQLGNLFTFALKGPSGVDPDAGVVELEVALPSNIGSTIITFPATYSPSTVGCPP